MRRHFGREQYGMTTTTAEITTTAEYFEVFGDTTHTALAGRVTRGRARLTPSAVTIPPSDLPAVELPEYEPTVADLIAIEAYGDEEIDAWIASANTLSAFEARRRDLRRLRADLPATALVDDPVDPDADAECVA
jgi:hypothetical protein